MTYLSSRVEFELMISCLIIHGLNKVIHYHEKTYSLKCLEITGSDAGPHKKVGSQPGDYRHFCLLRGFLWVCMG